MQGAVYHPENDDELREKREKEVYLFLNRYVDSYERGDLESFMRFFSGSVIENGKLTYSEMKPVYQRYFHNSRRKYMIRDVRIVEDGESVLVTAIYSVKRTTDDGERVIRGNIRWRLVRENDFLKIVKVDFDRS